MSRIYLAGPMDERDDWREEVQPELESLGLEVVKPELLTRYVLRFSVTTAEAGKILTQRDKHFASESEFVLVNFEGSTARSMGTCVELGWADNGFTTTVAVNPPGNPHFGHPIVENACDYSVPTMDAAISIIDALAWKNS